MKQKEKHKNCNTKHSTHHDSSTKPKIIVSDNKTETKIINRNAAEKNISIKPASIYFYIVYYRYYRGII